VYDQHRLLNAFQAWTKRMGPNGGHVATHGRSSDRLPRMYPSRKRLERATFCRHVLAEPGERPGDAA